MNSFISTNDVINECKSYISWNDVELIIRDNFSDDWLGIRPHTATFC